VLKGVFEGLELRVVERLGDFLDFGIVLVVVMINVLFFFVVSAGEKIILT
jgi:hypothetical protein